MSEDPQATIKRLQDENDTLRRDAAHAVVEKQEAHANADGWKIRASWLEHLAELDRREIAALRSHLGELQESVISEYAYDQNISTTTVMLACSAPTVAAKQAESQKGNNS